MLRGSYWACLFVLASGWMGTGLARAEPAPAPEVEASLDVFLKALPYDRRFPDRCKGELGVGVVARAGQADSLALAGRWAGALERELPRRFPSVSSAVRRLQIRVPADVEREVEALDILVLSPGLGDALEGLVALAERHRVLLLAVEPSYVELGAALGVDASRAPVLILSNPASARRQGSEFAHAFLKLTRQVGGPAAALAPAGDVSGPVLQQEAQVLKRRVAGRSPEYPERARRQGRQATLRVEILIDRQGEVQKMSFIEGDPMFEPKVVSALKGWRFAPELVDGRPVETLAVLKFDFRLESKPAGWLGR
jgi:TonB family protein